MDFQQLRCFLAVAEYLNFTQAAKQLYLGQPALSRQVAELEKELGVQLFFRNNRTVKLTDAGSVLYKYSSPILTKSTEAIEMTRQAALGFTGSLKIGYLGIDDEFLPRVIGSYHKRYPNSVVTINRFTWHDLNKALATNEVDISFTFSAGLERLSGIECHTISRQPLMIVLPSQHPLADQPDIPLSSLADESFILTRQDTSPLASAISMSLCLKHGFSPNIVYHSPLVEIVVMLVEAGLGVSILSRHANLCKRSTLRCFPIDDDEAYINMVVAWKKNNTNSSLPFFIEEIRKAYSLKNLEI